jgi:hypothetical protein
LRGDKTLNQHIDITIHVDNLFNELIKQLKEDSHVKITLNMNNLSRMSNAEVHYNYTEDGVIEGPFAQVFNLLDDSTLQVVTQISMNGNYDRKLLHHFSKYELKYYPELCAELITEAPNRAYELFELYDETSMILK